jgi:hypothetical protein
MASIPNGPSYASAPTKHYARSSTKHYVCTQAGLTSNRIARLLLLTCER